MGANVRKGKETPYTHVEEYLLMHFALVRVQLGSFMYSCLISSVFDTVEEPQR